MTTLINKMWINWLACNLQSAKKIMCFLNKRVLFLCTHTHTHNINAVKSKVVNHNGKGINSLSTVHLNTVSLISKRHPSKRTWLMFYWLGTKIRLRFQSFAHSVGVWRSKRVKCIKLDPFTQYSIIQNINSLFSYSMWSALKVCISNLFVCCW